MNKAVQTVFFHLLLLTALGVQAAPQWIEHASDPGPNLPQSGQSRFDDLFRQDSGDYHIPYPFTDLIASLEARFESPSTAVRQVYIPQGRALQRKSAAPDYFKHSRRVIAIDGEPRTDGSNAGQVLEYRLFIAHQPSTKTLEVISYNDEAGRFEFQMVEGYAANSSARVHQANRVMCLSCHQNAAPIFAQKPWSETSFSVDVANRLIKAQPGLHDSLADLVTHDAGIIDLLAERANYLSLAQYIWRYGCDNQACRAAMLRAILQYRLSNKASFNWHDARYRQSYYAELDNNWLKRWPRGLALANSRIPDRDPFAEPGIIFEQDPLFEREAHASWYRADSVLARGVIYRLAGFLTLADIQDLDRSLIMQHKQLSAGLRRYRANCEAGEVRQLLTTLICSDSDNPAGLRARIDVEDLDRFVAVRPLSIQVPGDTNIWQPDIVRQVQSENRIEMIPGIAQSGLSARLSNGDRIVSMTFHRLSSRNLQLQIEISDESSLIDATIDKLLLGNAEGLSAGPFRRRLIVGELIHHFDMPKLNWSAIRNPLATTGSIANPGLTDDLALLNPYCAHCHAEDSRMPPGFLFGADANKRIRQCAPRILARLESWQHFPDLQRSPMPPPASLNLSGVNQRSWPLSDHYRSLVDAVRAISSDRYSGMAYRDLPPCLSEH